ncbi:hypothetical protein [Aquimarina algiphila]|uniref:Uncharacterized protein n=1 Tax=Aquimarina algiphila TaxID=2047982 RepID=A0A554VRN6_9FLAO|nr:hypothetical protein [Aquimarina algiphila]TSE11312.1 hypothetical protein FOF46_01395 [Aquimarina algiphila]
MSIYNLLNPTRPETCHVLPLLGKHPRKEYPRFRNSFLTEEKKIVLMTRTGGGNRKAYKIENRAIKKHPNYLYDYDDPFDKTFAYWFFSVPEEFENDVTLILLNLFKGTSKEYQNTIKTIMIEQKEQLEILYEGTAESIPIQPVSEDWIKSHIKNSIEAMKK